MQAAWFALLVPFWAVTAYLTLPRLHRILTPVYVPDYFFGRTRTSEGMLGDPVNLAADEDIDAEHDRIVDSVNSAPGVGDRMPVDVVREFSAVTITATAAAGCAPMAT